ncbi:hypothetical protein [Streptomyces aurantiacus]|uniref:hypothetical protein n=1 Tax=Streptomyces aurantiacus TaxID=47760 RepID=UPI0027D91386|nr:hypothetical protein [Streptomyces aurantiacus]
MSATAVTALVMNRVARALGVSAGGDAVGLPPGSAGTAADAVEAWLSSAMTALPVKDSLIEL